MGQQKKLTCAGALRLIGTAVRLAFDRVVEECHPQPYGVGAIDLLKNGCSGGSIGGQAE